MRADDDELLPDDDAIPVVAPARSDVSLRPEADPWKVLIVDDDRAVSMVSELVLRDVRVDGVSLRLLMAGTAAEARALLTAHPDIAVALIDVIMEHRSAGIDLVDWIRRDLGNHAIRLVIRTGEPGSAPEQRVMADHDLHDYLAKTETTSRRLISCVTGAIRAWRDHQVIRRQERALRKVVEAVDGLLETGTFDEVARGAVAGALTLVDPPAYAGCLARWGPEGPAVVAALPSPAAFAVEAAHAGVSTAESGRVIVTEVDAWYVFDLDQGPDDTVPVRWALGIRHDGLADSDGHVLGLYGRALALALHNRAAWQRTLDTVTRALAEREVMLREIHHRVKNNLQITSSLLTMQAEESDNLEIRAALADSGGRVRAMAVVHDQLYGSSDLSRVAFDDFVRSLTQPLVAALGPSAQVHFDLAPVWFNLERSIPMGLILNELLTNAFKYGRSADGQLRVAIALVRDADSATLSLRDHGRGFSVPFHDLSRRSLGLRMVHSLAHQLRAKVSARSEDGAEVTLKIPLLAEERTG